MITVLACVFPRFRLTAPFYFDLKIKHDTRSKKCSSRWECRHSLITVDATLQDLIKSLDCVRFCLSQQYWVTAVSSLSNERFREQLCVRARIIFFWSLFGNTYLVANWFVVRACPFFYFSIECISKILTLNINCLCLLRLLERRWKVLISLKYGSEKSSFLLLDFLGDGKFMGMK